MSEASKMPAQDFVAIKAYCERRLETAANNKNMRAAVAWAKLEHIAFRCATDANKSNAIPDYVADEQDAEWDSLVDDLWGDLMSPGEFSDAACCAGFSNADVSAALSAWETSHG